MLIQFADLRCSRRFRRVGKGSLFCNFFLSSILESFEEHRGSMLMIKIDNRLPKLGVDILFLFSFQGMQVEGIYRVNGNQADIGLIEQKIEESEFENQLQ